eukprot:snap_masked-scaffold_15-processed-gene-3.13-mRNA-1 protein AED:1.00 eAED:1.00 QI:0/-1/0/0/-1/1/1/0/212
MKLGIFMLLFQLLKAATVMEMTSQEFLRLVGNPGDKWLIEFYSPRCGHCRNFASTYKDIGNTLHRQRKAGGSNVRVAKVDATQEVGLSILFGIKAYPTFFHVDGTSVREFKGRRGKEQLLSYATEDYLKDDPLSMWSSPFGPVGRIKTLVIGFVNQVSSTHTNIRKEYNLSKNKAAGLMLVSAFALTVIIVVFFVSFYICCATRNTGKLHKD